jgi:putative transposase
VKESGGLSDPVQTTKNLDVRAYKDKPPRLDQLYPAYTSPLYFITFCAWQRKPILANPDIRASLVSFGASAGKRGIVLGRYTIMPDHIHLFIAPGLEGDLSLTVQLMKRALGASLRKAGIDKPYWQPGFFDRLLRRSDSYSAKWDYVRENPVRAGLVKEADEWPYQGEIEQINW